MQLPGGGCSSGIHMTDNKGNFQLIWGVALVAVGSMMFLSIPQKMMEIEKQFTSSPAFLRFSLYLVSIFLFFGGVKKLYDGSAMLRKKKNPPPMDNHHEMKRR
jgi:hypothetical protein